MADEDDLATVAQQFIDMFGRAAIEELNERADIAAGMGDYKTAETWREIARTAERVLG